MQKDLLMDRKRSIGMAAEELSIPTHVIRFWETQFPQIKPEIGKGSRRYYLTKDIETIKKIKYFLHERGYTIKGLQNLLSSNKEILKQSLEDIKNVKYTVNGEVISAGNPEISIDDMQKLNEFAKKARDIVVRIDKLIMED